MQWYIIARLHGMWRKAGPTGGMSNSRGSVVKLKNNLPPFSLAERNKSMYKNSTRYLWNLSNRPLYRIVVAATVKCRSSGNFIKLKCSIPFVHINENLGFGQVMRDFSSITHIFLSRLCRQVRYPLSCLVGYVSSVKHRTTWRW